MTDPPAKDVQRAAVRSVVRRQLLIGGVLLAGGVQLTVASGSPLLALPMLLGAAVALWAARLSSRSSTQATDVNRILQRHAAGDIDGAWAAIDAFEATAPLPYLRRTAQLQRVMVAFQRGDLELVTRHAKEASEGRHHWTSRVFERRTAAEARSFLALVGALRGETRDRALEDAVRGEPEANPSAIARLALAEMLRLDHEAKTPELERAMKTHGRFVVEALTRRERSLYRAIERKLTRRSPGVYRRPAERDVAPADEGLTWGERIAPGLAPFIHVANAPLANGSDDASARAVAPTPLEGIPRVGRAAWRIPVIAGAGVALLAIGMGASIAGSAATPGDRSGVALIVASPLVFVAFALAFVVWSVRQAKTQRLAVATEARRAASGESVDDEALARVARGRHVLVGAEASLLRARQADKRADFERSVSLATEGMGLASANAQVKFISSAALFPHLLAQRAAALAALGREDAALADLARLETSFSPYPLLPCVRHGVRMLVAARRGDVALLASLAQQAQALPTLDHRIELLGDLARAAVVPEQVGAAEVARIQGTLATDAEIRRWVSAVRADLVTRLEEAADRLDANAETAAERDAENEAEAQSEAEPGARMLSAARRS